MFAFSPILNANMTFLSLFFPLFLLLFPLSLSMIPSCAFSMKLLSWLFPSKSIVKQEQPSSSSSRVPDQDTTFHIMIYPLDNGNSAAIHCLYPPPFVTSASPCTASPKRSSLAALFKFSAPKNKSNHHQLSLFTTTATTASKRFQQLPIELIQHIIQLLDYDSILRFSETCRFYHSLLHANNHALWQALLQSHFQLRRCSSSTSNTRLLYQQHALLARRWRRGKPARTRYLRGHTDSVYCLVRVNQRYLISGSRDRSVKLWDLHQFKVIATQTQHEGSVLCLCVFEEKHRHNSTSTVMMITGSSDATCLVWTVHQQELRPTGMRLRGHAGGILDVCVLPRMFVSASRDGTVRVWDRETGREMRRLVGHAGPVNSLQTHGDHHVVSASGDGTLKLWDPDSGQCLRTFEGHTRGLACVRSDGTRIYSGGQDAVLRIWNPETGQCLASLKGHEGLIRTIDCYKVS